MKRVLMVFWFLASVLAFGLPARDHVHETARVLDILRIPAEYGQLEMFHRAIDTVPAYNVPGGWYHREKWGHDVNSLKKLLSYDSHGLSTSQRKIAWAIHMLQDFKTKAGVPYKSVVEARKILSRECFKLTTIRALEYTAVMSVFDFIYQVALMDVDTGTALKNTIKKLGITTGTAIGVTFLTSRIFPYIYSQSSTFLSFLSSGLVGPIIYMATDVTWRAITSGSFMEALFSPQTLLNAAIITASSVLLFVPGGQFIAPAVMVFGGIFSWIRAREIKARYELFNEVFNREYGEYLLLQAEMSVKGS